LLESRCQNLITVSSFVGHQALNKLVARAFVSAGTLVTKESNGLSRSDGKRPDGLFLIPWQEGKPICWDVTVIRPLVNSYLQSATASAGAVAEFAATRKVAKYSALEDQYLPAHCCRVSRLHEL